MNFYVTLTTEEKDPAKIKEYIRTALEHYQFTQLEFCKYNVVEVKVMLVPEEER